MVQARLSPSPPFLAARDEIPYLLDLHLFLSRPLSTAPVKAIGEAAQSCMDPSVSLLGAFPQARVPNGGRRG